MGRQFEALAWTAWLPSFTFNRAFNLSSFLLGNHSTHPWKVCGPLFKGTEESCHGVGLGYKSCEICFGHRNHIIGNSGSLLRCCLLTNFLLTSHARHVHLVAHNSFLKTFLFVFKPQFIKGDKYTGQWASCYISLS